MMCDKEDSFEEISDANREFKSVCTLETCLPTALGAFCILCPGRAKITDLLTHWHLLF